MHKSDGEARGLVTRTCTVAHKLQTASPCNLLLNGLHCVLTVCSESALPSPPLPPPPLSSLLHFPLNHSRSLLQDDNAFHGCAPMLKKEHQVVK